MLLALVTALIVARPLVIGEDPGLSANLADPWGLVLILLWLLAAIGWAAWRYWLRPGGGWRVEGGESKQNSTLYPPPSPLHDANWYGGLVQTALLATVAVVFISAESAASYKFPARLIAWEWFGLFVSFLVVRQLAVTQIEQHGLFTVVLAGAVALSGQGIYQECVELPQNRKLAANPDDFRAKWAEENPGQSLSESYLEQLRQRAMENNIYGPYAHPNSYAGFLVLGLPGLLGGVVVSRRMNVSKWQSILALICALLGLAALWLTHSRGAILGLAIAGLGVGLFVYRHKLRSHVLAVMIGMAVLIGLIVVGWWSDVLTTGMGKSGKALEQRLEYWRTTWQMIQERPWLGVGPGNFGENYPRLMPANSEEKIKDPHNFALEMWATCGVFAVVTLLMALAAFFVQIMRELRRAEGELVASGERQPPDVQDHGADAPGSPDVRWEFYVGGMFGLVLGFVLRVNTATPGNILAETYSAAVRSVVWFAAYALLERLTWTDRGRVLALTAGIAALLLNLCVSGGIGFPSIAGPLWIAIALALNASGLRPTSWLSRAGAAVILPLPIFIGLFLGYGVYILYPLLASDSLVREAVQAVAFFQTENAKPIAERSAGVRDNPTVFLKIGVIDRLEQAAQLTPDDARIYVQLAWWNNVIGELNPRRKPNALRYGEKATRIDPRGAEGYLVQYQIHMGYAKRNQDSAAELRKNHGDPKSINDLEYTARAEYKKAAETLKKYLPNDPHDATLHFALWRAWRNAGDKEKAREHAAKALELDELITAPARKLTESQRKQLAE